MDVNQIFKALACLVHEQGEVLGRLEYNCHKKTFLHVYTDLEKALSPRSDCLKCFDQAFSLFASFRDIKQQLH